jgi:hypothetical protein
MGRHKAKKRESDAIRQARHERREKARKDRQAERRQQPRPPVVNAKFVLEYGCAILEACGPQFFCEWGVPAATVDFLKNAGRPVPAPIVGALLLDTGATRTCIALKTANDLGLQPRRMVDGLGAAGEHKNQVFLACLHIKITDPVTKQIIGFAWEQEVEGIPELHRFAAPLMITGQTSPTPVSGLLGRDILKHAKIYYDGPAGKMRFEFDMASVRSIQGQPSR